jgi:hypothetical protein
MAMQFASQEQSTVLWCVCLNQQRQQLEHGLWEILFTTTPLRLAVSLVGSALPQERLALGKHLAQLAHKDYYVR